MEYINIALKQIEKVSNSPEESEMFLRELQRIETEESKWDKTFQQRYICKNCGWQSSIYKICRCGNLLEVNPICEYWK